MRNLRDIRKGLGWLVTLLSLLSLASGCTYKNRVAPLNLPDVNNGGVVVGGGLKISALAFSSDDAAKQAFGFGARNAGLLPIQLTLQNDSPDKVRLNPEQTFLIDNNNRAWPILSLEKTYQRTSGHVDLGETAKGAGKPALLMGAAGALAGLAVGVVTGKNVGEAMGTGAVLGAAGGAIIGGGKSYVDSGEKIRDDLAAKTLRNEAILPHQIAYGVLFFPGMPGEEADSVKELRLSVTIGNTPQVVILIPSIK
ncbi:MAG: hypothetical protein FP813_04380 [Desulfurivibrio sp.]|nr:hypothetical protein [Desulfurivibrio sp.]MBU3936322.1 hypothetical protein [Pseudomonadota bacterium]MBU4118888.1 hypothetical protein [Pseudomonadota bacterium]